mgnify:CR=1 FL=1
MAATTDLPSVELSGLPDPKPFEPGIRRAPNRVARESHLAPAAERQTESLQQELDRVDAEIERLEARDDDRPFFLWVHYHDPHLPYVPPEPFKTRFADRPYDGEIAYTDEQLGRLVDELRRRGVAVETVPPENTSSYGIVAVEKTEQGQRMTEIVEKPKPEDAPSDLGVVGRYILTPEIFRHLARTGRGAGGEVPLTDGIARLLEREKVMAYAFEGRRYDCGSKLGYLQANLDYALKHEDLGADFEAWVKQRLGLN